MRSEESSTRASRVGPYDVEHTGDEVHFLVNRVVWRRETKQFLYAGTLALLCLQGALYEAHRLDFIPATAFVTLAIAWGMGYVRLPIIGPGDRGLKSRTT